MKDCLPLGKLPQEYLERLVNNAPITDRRVLIGPGVGLDCAVVEVGDKLLVYKSDPITFVTNEIGWYAVQVNSNDIATTGATPQWFLMTLLLPEENSTKEVVEEIFNQVYRACEDIKVSVIGGHTEITYGLDRPILVGTMVGEVERDRLVTPLGITHGDRMLITKGVPIEATAIAAREFPDRLANKISRMEIENAREYLYKPGISVLRDAYVAQKSGKVSGMHDPTEGGIYAALWELAKASKHTIYVDPELIHVSEISRRICQILRINPLGAIASGALLITTPEGEVSNITNALRSEGITCKEIGWVEDGIPEVWMMKEGKPVGLLPLPRRDEIAKLYEN